MNDHKHYEMPVQPVEFIAKNEMPYLEGNVVKYVSRHEHKNGAEDVVKAIHYCQFILKYKYGLSSDFEMGDLKQNVEL